MNNLKILHVVPTLKKDGAEVQLSMLFKEIKNLNIELFTFDLHDNGDSIMNSLDGIKVYSTSTLSSFFAIYKLFKENDYDIIHSHLPKSDFVIGILKIFNKKINHVVSVHAQYGTRAGENKLKYFFANKIWNKILNKSNAVIAISDKINTWLVEDRNINKNLVTTIYYGIKINNRSSKFKPSNTIGMAARVLPWKGWDKVLETAYYLKKEGVNFNLKLAGSDDEGYLNTVQSMIKEFKLEDNVEIFDHFSNIDDFFKQIDLFLFLSSSEGFGLVALEAIENNVAVICSDISPLNEFVLNINNCLVERNNTVYTAQIIQSLFENDCKKLITVQKKQKEHIINNFSISESASKIEKLYISTINV